MIRPYSYLRMSTQEQLKGDSLRQQLEQSRDYAAKNGMTLVEDLRDIGISAFHGANAAGGGALGLFLAAVKAGKVEAGSYLLIESLDRLSRQIPFKAYGTFAEIISAGVRMVTLSDSRVYDSELDLGGMISSIVDMEREREQSESVDPEERFRRWAESTTYYQERAASL